MDEFTKMMVTANIFAALTIIALFTIIKYKNILVNRAIVAGEEILETSHFWQQRHSDAQNNLNNVTRELTYLKDVNIQLNKQRDSNAAMYLEEKKGRLNIIEDYKKRLDEISKLNKTNREAFACIEKQDKKITILKSVCAEYRKDIVSLNNENKILTDELGKTDLELNISEAKLLKLKTNEKLT